MSVKPGFLILVVFRSDTLILRNAGASQTGQENVKHHGREPPDELSLRGTEPGLQG